MRYVFTSLLATIFVVAWMPTLADDVAEQRARLANQRIQVEEERRAREEAERLNQQASEPAAPAYADEGANEDAVSDVSAERMEMSRALEQLRELGALRDAGYVTEEEFEQLKKKILDAAL